MTRATDLVWFYEDTSPPIHFEYSRLVQSELAEQTGAVEWMEADALAAHKRGVIGYRFPHEVSAPSLPTAPLTRVLLIRS